MDIEAEILDLKRRLSELERVRGSTQRPMDRVAPVGDDLRRLREELPHIVAGAVRAALRYHS
jgi:hypothetical protein